MNDVAPALRHIPDPDDLPLDRPASVYSKIREDIIEGRIPADSRLKVRDLAARYGLMISDTAPVTGGVLQPGQARVVITRGFAEMTRMGVALGGQAETVAGLCGLGDLVLTCSSPQSRNMSVGLALGGGQTLDEALAGKVSVAEGVASAPAVRALARSLGVETPICEAVAAILAGEVHFAIGYSEPEAGTDLAALRTSAVRHGDEYIVNGQKIWTTGGHDADYVWLACRTDPEAAKHKGISILIVDTTDPGYSWTPIILSDGAHHTNATYYNDVRVPADMLVGEENAGWRLITTQLNHERVMLGPAGKIAGLYDRVHAWASKPGGNGITPIDHDDVRRCVRIHCGATARTGQRVDGAPRAEAES